MILKRLYKKVSDVLAFPILKVKPSIDTSLVKTAVHTFATKLLFVSGACSTIYIN